MIEQLILDLPAIPALGREDFFVSTANVTAVNALEDWRNWPHRKMALIGEQGAGKSHLTRVWAGASGARVIAAQDLTGIDIKAVCEGPVAVEDADRIAGQDAHEIALFHLHNLVLAQGHSLLVTGGRAPAHWPLTLPDLKSRMAATPIVPIDAPDDALLAAGMLKLFADRQLQVSPNLLSYLTRRIDRTFAAARTTVEALDRAALAQGRAVTRSLAAAVLDNACKESA
ncbi:MAG: chromosomal replication initiator DnaA [Halocynthiibacter sp.]